MAMPTVEVGEGVKDAVGVGETVGVVDEVTVGEDVGVTVEVAVGVGVRESAYALYRSIPHHPSSATAASIKKTTPILIKPIIAKYGFNERFRRITPGSFG